MNPLRIKLSRRGGFNLQEESWKLNGLSAVNCSRPSMYGNPNKVTKEFTAEDAVALFRDQLCLSRLRDREHFTNWMRPLRGKNLACWCHIWRCPKCGKYADYNLESGRPVICDHGNINDVANWTTMLRVPCHADVLLEIANTP